MKTNKTMRLTLAVTAASSFFFGLDQYEAPAKIYNCVNSCCEMEYAWNYGVNGTHCSSAQVKDATFPFGPGDNSDRGITKIWVAVASGGGCNLVGDGVQDLWDWTSNTGTCFDKVKNAWQFPQGVQPAGTATKTKSGANRFKCSP